MRPPPPRNFVGEMTPQVRPKFLTIVHGPDPPPPNILTRDTIKINTPFEQAVQRSHQLNSLPLVEMNAAKQSFRIGKPNKGLFASNCSQASLNGALAKRPPGKKVVTVFSYE